MPDPITDTPTSPPAFPVIPAGLGTKIGLAGTALLGIVAALAPLLPDTGAGTSTTLATLATILASVTVLGRMLQAAAVYIGGGTPPSLSSVLGGGERGQGYISLIIGVLLVLILLVVLVRLV